MVQIPYYPPFPWVQGPSEPHPLGPPLGLLQSALLVAVQGSHRMNLLDTRLTKGHLHGGTMGSVAFLDESKRAKNVKKV